MVAAIVILTIVSTIVLVLENRLPIGHEMKSITNDSPESDNASKLCEDSSVTMIRACHICNDLEQKSLIACKATNYVEKLKCQSSQGNDEEFSRSCQKLSRTEERRFWAFECTTAAVGMASYGVVYLRQKRLERLLIEKVHRQIAAGV